MSWLDDHRAEALGAFRAKFTDDEWAAFKRGECCVTVSYGTVTQIVMCGESRRHNRIYCAGHNLALRDMLGVSADDLRVPFTVSAMDLEEVP